MPVPSGNTAAVDATNDTLILALAAIPASAAALRRAAANFAAHHGADDGLCADIALAVSEACSNAIIHAYRQASEPGEIRLSAEVDDSRIIVRVSDDGTGMAPRPDSPGAGLGLPLMAKLSQDLEVRRDRGTTVTMHFQIEK